MKGLCSYHVAHWTFTLNQMLGSSLWYHSIFRHNPGTYRYIYVHDTHTQWERQCKQHMRRPFPVGGYWNLCYYLADWQEFVQHQHFHLQKNRDVCIKGGNINQTGSERDEQKGKNRTHTLFSRAPYIPWRCLQSAEESADVNWVAPTLSPFPWCELDYLVREKGYKKLRVTSQSNRTFSWYRHGHRKQKAIQKPNKTQLKKKKKHRPSWPSYVLFRLNIKRPLIISTRLCNVIEANVCLLSYQMKNRSVLILSWELGWAGFDGTQPTSTRCTQSFKLVCIRFTFTALLWSTMYTFWNFLNVIWMSS